MSIKWNWIAYIILFITICSEKGFPQNKTDIKCARFPDQILIGHYTILRNGEPRRMTLREDIKYREEGGVYSKPVGGEIRGIVKYPADCSLGIVIADDANGTILDKLNSLKEFDVLDIQYMFILGKLDINTLLKLSTFSEIRDLTLTASEVFESADGCSALRELKNVQYFQLIGEDDLVFGSRCFCETMLTWKRLKYLSMPCEKLRDADVAILASHGTIDRLFLRARRPVLGSRSLEAIQKMSHLRELAIVCTEDVADEHVMGFAEIMSLENFSLATNATIRCKERIVARRPDCRFSFLSPSEEFE